MGDYLGNLVAKSLGQVEVVQPRPVSRFEPLPLAGGLSPGYPLDLEAAEDGQTFVSLSRTMALEAPVAPPHWPSERPPETVLGPPIAPRQRGPGDLTDPGRRSEQATDRLPLPLRLARMVPGSELARSPPPLAPEIAARPGPLPPPVGQTPDQSLPPPVAAFQPVEVRHVSPPDQPSAAPSSVKPVTGQPLPSPAAVFQPLGARHVPPPDQPAPGLAPRVRPRDAQLFPAGASWQPILDRPRLPLTDSGSETDVTPPHSVVEEPIVRQLVIERVISPAPAEAARQGATKQEGHMALEPAVKQPVRLEMEDRLTGRGTRDEPGRPSLVVEPLSFEKQPRPATVVAQPHVRPAQRVEPAAPKPAPTIHVTIGSVQVRATPPPVPTPKKQRPRPPVMSLDEYLRQRNRGGSQ